MSKEKWIYFKLSTGDGVLKVDSQFVADLLPEIGFIECSYFDYLRVMKQVMERDHDIEIQAVTREE